MKTFRIDIESFDLISYYDTYHIEAENRHEAITKAFSRDYDTYDTETNYDPHVGDEQTRVEISNAIRNNKRFDRLEDAYEIESESDRERKKILEEQRETIAKLKHQNEQLKNLK